MAGVRPDSTGPVQAPLGADIEHSQCCRPHSRSQRSNSVIDRLCRITGELAGVAEQTMREATAVIRTARGALHTATGQRKGRLRRAVTALNTLIGHTGRVVAQTRSRLAGVMPESVTRWSACTMSTPARSARDHLASPWRSVISPTRRSSNTVVAHRCGVARSRNRQCSTYSANGSGDDRARTPHTGHRPALLASARPPLSNGHTDVPDPRPGCGPSRPARAQPRSGHAGRVLCGPAVTLRTQ